VAVLSPLLDILVDVLDPRRAQGQLYKLSYVLLISTLAIVIGCNSYRGVERRRSPDFDDFNNRSVARRITTSEPNKSHRGERRHEADPQPAGPGTGSALRASLWSVMQTQGRGRFKRFVQGSVQTNCRKRVLVLTGASRGPHSPRRRTCTAPFLRNKAARLWTSHPLSCAGQAFEGVIQTLAWRVPNDMQNPSAHCLTRCCQVDSWRMLMA